MPVHDVAPSLRRPSGTNSTSLRWAKWWPACQKRAGLRPNCSNLATLILKS